MKQSETKKSKRNLRCVLNNDELRSIGKDLADKTVSLQQAQDDKKRVTSDYAAKISGLEDRTVISLDVESTGLDPAKDRIVSIGLECCPSKSTFPIYQRFNPGVVMSDEVIAIHGITNEIAAKEKPFSELASFIHRLLTEGNPVLLGFNLLNFDIPIIWEEFYRAGITWDLSKHLVIDAGNIFKKKEQRTLEAAVQFYTHRSHEGAHNALEDANATLAVLDGQLRRYQDLDEMPIEEVAKFSHMDENRIDLAGKLVRDADGDAVYNFGKSKGVKIKDDPGLANWMLDKDFSANTKLAIQAELDQLAFT